MRVHAVWFAWFCAVATASEARAAPPPQPQPSRPRVIVLTDISSLTAGVAEPDDGQSMIRFLLYANEFDVEGLIASSNLGHGQKCRPDLLHAVVAAYSQVHGTLRRHDDGYPSPAALAAVIKSGQAKAGPAVPLSDSLGAGKDTEGSDWIISVVDRPDPRPVWVLIWGGSADLGQALWKVRQTRAGDQIEAFLSKLRIHAISEQDSTGPWIRENFPTLSLTLNRRALRGMYRGGDTSLVSADWVRAHVHGHGALGDLYPNYNGGDIWSRELGPVKGIKEGDTPSFLALIPNGLTDPGRPELGSWGGRFERAGPILVDVPDHDLETRGDPDPRMSSVYRWRPAYQADFQARLDWCVKPYAEANHPPDVRVEGGGEVEVAPGAEVTLDAGATTDPDGDHLRFQWSTYPAEHEVLKRLVIEDRTAKQARLKVPPEASSLTIPILLTVEDQGHPRLTRYGRIRLKVANP